MTEIIFVRPSQPRSDLTYSAIQPSYRDQADVVAKITEHLYENKEQYRVHPHPARCEAITTIKQMGWILRTDVEVRGDQRCVSDMFMERYDIEDDWTLVKYRSHWGVYIPPNYNLIEIPTLYHSGRYFTMPGVLDGDEGMHLISTFIVMKKDDILPAGTPISQLFLSHKEESKPTYQIRDRNAIDEKTYQLKFNALRDPEKRQFNIAKKNGLLYNPLYEKE